MIYALYIFSGFAAILHVFIFYLETIAWQSPLAKKTFGLSDETARQTKEMAANQGVYNLLLAVITFVGIALAASGANAVGISLILAGCGAMLGAALYLFMSSSKKAAALKQMAFPVVATIIAIIVIL